jgi:hypothetical protein
MKALCDRCRREYENYRITAIEDYEKKGELLCGDCQDDADTEAINQESSK